MVDGWSLKEAGNTFINFTYNTREICINIDRSMCLFERCKGLKKGTEN